MVEYTRHPDCLFRVQLATSNDDYMLSDGTCVRGGDQITNLHVWNEQFPCFAGNGPTLAWARRVNHAFDASLRELAQFLDSRSDFDDVVAICGNMSFEPAERSTQLARFVSRFGFERVAPASSRSFRQQIHWFGENILISMMVLARNAAPFGPIRCGAIVRWCFYRAGSCGGAMDSHADNRLSRSPQVPATPHGRQGVR